MSKVQHAIMRDIRKFLHSVWLFPAIITVILLGFTAFKISGSSLGIYDNPLGISQHKDVIANQPRGVRSDEWLVVTQLTIAQERNHYKEIDSHIGNTGTDMSLFGDLPVKDWSTIFRPENWAFFVIPFEHAFAFKWWFMGWLLMVSCYFFVLKLLPGKKLWAALISTALFFSPFVQWWYQFSTLACIYYALFIGLIFMYMVDAKPKPVIKNVFLTGVLAYTLACFILVLYPPFMIACGFGAGLFCIGYLLEKRTSFARKDILWLFARFAIAIIVAGLITLLFLDTRKDAVHALTSTVYPGARVMTGGGLQVNKFFAGYLNVPLQSESQALGYDSNQSENSRFLPLAPFLLLPSIYLIIYKYRREKKIDWPFVGINAAALILLIRSFSPVLDFILNPFFFSKLPPQRSLIWLGIVNVIQLVLFLRIFSLKVNSSAIKRNAAVIYSLVTLAATIAIALSIHHEYPAYIRLREALILSVAFTLIIYLLLAKHLTIALSVLLILSLGSTYQVNPLTHGMAPLTSTSLSVTIQKLSAHSNGKWISESLQFENFATMNGANSLSGVYPYPQLSIWKDLPPRDPSIYNRYAHVIFVINHTSANSYPTTHLKFIQTDLYLVYTEPCSAFLKKNNVKFILAQSPIDNACVSLKTKVSYPKQTFYIYTLN